MEYTIGNVKVSSRFPETLTQNYHAGALMAAIHVRWPEIQTPPIVQCMVHFHSLRELLGDKLWAKLRTHNRTKSRVQIYEKLTYQPSHPTTMIGTNREFMLGYVRVYERSKVKKIIDESILEDQEFILNKLSSL